MNRMRKFAEMLSIKKPTDPSTPLMIPVSKFDIPILIAVIVLAVAYYCWTQLLN